MQSPQSPSPKGKHPTVKSGASVGSEIDVLAMRLRSIYNLAAKTDRRLCKFRCPCR